MRPISSLPAQLTRVDSAQYAELFLTESREHVSAINHSLLALERGAGGDEPVGAIFRGVHTIKGMSATMGYTAVAALSHELETLLDLVRKGGRTVDARLMDLLFRAADLLERSIESAVSGVAAVDVAPMVAQLQAQAVAPSAAPAMGNGAAAPANGAANGATGVRQQRSVRIDLRRLDNLMNLIGELVITRGRLVELTGAIDDAALTETIAQTSRLV